MWFPPQVFSVWIADGIVHRCSCCTALPKNPYQSSSRSQWTSTEWLLIVLSQDGMVKCWSTVHMKLARDGPPSVRLMEGTELWNEMDKMLIVIWSYDINLHLLLMKTLDFWNWTHLWVAFLCFLFFFSLLSCRLLFLPGTSTVTPQPDYRPPFQ